MDLEITVDGLGTHRVAATRTRTGAMLWIDGRAHRGAREGAGDTGVVVLDDRAAHVHTHRDGDVVHVHALGRTWRVDVVDPAERSQRATATADVLTAPMPGSVVALPVAVADVVAAGQLLMVIESMKMHSELHATRDGVVDRIHLALGETFDRGAPLVTLAPEPKAEDAA